MNWTCWISWIFSAYVYESNIQTISVRRRIWCILQHGHQIMVKIDDQPHPNWDTRWCRPSWQLRTEAARSVFWRLEPTDGIPPSLMLIYSWLHHVCTMIQGYFLKLVGTRWCPILSFKLVYNLQLHFLGFVVVWGHHLVSPFDRLSANLRPRLRSPPRVSPKVSPKPSPRPSEPSEQELESESSPVWR